MERKSQEGHNIHVPMRCMCFQSLRVLCASFSMAKMSTVVVLVIVGVRDYMTATFRRTRNPKPDQLFRLFFSYTAFPSCLHVQSSYHVRMARLSEVPLSVCLEVALYKYVVTITMTLSCSSLYCSSEIDLFPYACVHLNDCVFMYIIYSNVAPIGEYLNGCLFAYVSLSVSVCVCLCVCICLCARVHLSRVFDYSKAQVLRPITA